MADNEHLDIVIPHYIQIRTDLTAQEMMLFGLIYSICSHTMSKCFASDTFLSDRLRSTRKWTNKTIKRFVILGLLNKEGFGKARQLSPTVPPRGIVAQSNCPPQRDSCPPNCPPQRDSSLNPTVPPRGIVALPTVPNCPQLYPSESNRTTYLESIDKKVSDPTSLVKACAREEPEEPLTHFLKEPNPRTQDIQTPFIFGEMTKAQVAYSDWLATLPVSARPTSLQLENFVSRHRLEFGTRELESVLVAFFKYQLQRKDSRIPSVGIWDKRERQQASQVVARPTTSRTYPILQPQPNDYLGGTLEEFIAFQKVNRHLTYAERVSAYRENLATPTEGYPEIKEIIAVATDSVKTISSSMTDLEFEKTRKRMEDQFSFLLEAKPP
jgi:hypothetical protein